MTKSVYAPVDVESGRVLPKRKAVKHCLSTLIVLSPITSAFVMTACFSETFNTWMSTSGRVCCSGLAHVRLRRGETSHSRIVLSAFPSLTHYLCYYLPVMVAKPIGI